MSQLMIFVMYLSFMKTNEDQFVQQGPPLIETCGSKYISRRCNDVEAGKEILSNWMKDSLIKEALSHAEMMTASFPSTIFTLEIRWSAPFLFLDLNF